LFFALNGTSWAHMLPLLPVHPPAGSVPLGTVSAGECGGGSYIDDVHGQSESVAPGDVVQAVATCPSGEKAITGGYVLGGDVGLAVASVTANYPGTEFTDWYVKVANPKEASGSVTVTPTVRCIEEFALKP
jgi:hypothetical protein